MPDTPKSPSPVKPVLLGLAGLGALAWLAMRYPRQAQARSLPRMLPAPAPAPTPAAAIALPPVVPHAAESPSIADIIAQHARAAGINPRLAMAFADLESGINPGALHDQDWATRDGCANYRKHVLGNAKFNQNPGRGEPAAWMGYGLFGLMSPFFLGALEHPRVLLDPNINAMRGTGLIAQHLRSSGGNVRDARLRYVGCYPAERCSPTKVAQIDRRLQDALRKWGVQ